MGVLHELIKEIQTLENDRDSAEINSINSANKTNEIKNLICRIQTRIRLLEEQTEKAKQGITRPAFWRSVEEVIDLNKEIAEVLHEPPPPEEE